MNDRIDAVDPAGLCGGRWCAIDDLWDDFGGARKLHYERQIQALSSVSLGAHSPVMTA